MEVDTSTRIIIILLLILCSSYFSIAEISLAASQKTRLQQMFDAGDRRAKLVLDLQDKPGPFFSAIQIVLNALAILGGIVGETLLSPFFEAILVFCFPNTAIGNWAFLLSFLTVTLFFALFADLIPKRVALSAPERIAVNIIRGTQLLVLILRPLVWLLTTVSNSILKLLNVPLSSKRNITNEDILATIEAGTRAGVLDTTEKNVIKNVIGMEDRFVTSAMTPRDYCVFFTLTDTVDVIRQKIEDHPHGKFLVCDKDIDHVIGYVDSKILLTRMLKNEKFTLVDKNLIHSVPAVPDTISLSEVLDTYKKAGTDFAIVINEYALTLGVITLNDVMSTVMGDMVPLDEEDPLIVKRDENTWLIDGTAPVLDVASELNINAWPEDGMYETIAGFMIVLLRKVPRVTDKVVYAGYRFEVIDVERNRIDQILVTKINDETVAMPKQEENLDQEKAQ